MLIGTGRLADDLWLLAHDDATGKPLLHSRALGAGLAGALLAELMFAGAIQVRHDRIRVITPDRPDGKWSQPGDDLGRTILGVLRGEPGRHPVRDWLTFLGITAGEDVARRLGRAGYLAEASSRWPWRGTRWVPTDPDRAFAAPMIQVKTVMAEPRSGKVSAVVLTGMAIACGLGPHMLPYGPPGARRNAESSVRILHPGLRELIAQTQAAVDGALLSHRV